jgi:transposase
MHYIGLDVGKKRLHAAWLMDRERERARPKAVDNTPEGHAQLLAWTERQTKAGAAELCVVMEATGVYHEAVAAFLHAAGCHVCVVNPLHAKRFAESRGIRTKNDRRDGRVLALFGAERRPPAWQPPPPEVRRLERLLQRRETLEADRQRECNRLEKAEVEDAPAPVIESLRTMIAALDAEIERLDREIDDHFQAHPGLKAHRERLQSIPGVGAKLSVWFVALLAAKDFRSAKQAAAFLGLNPVEYESGTSVHRPPHLSKAGNGRWRARLYMPAVVATTRNPIIRAQYQRLLGAGKTKMSALGAAMRKLVHIAFGVFKHRQPFALPVADAAAS